jgi:diaminohydroxyphosphoribosylaminopyrimidine deaminase/5-amino-6-(5-phosphoribosylamino)uracil reductase
VKVHEKYMARCIQLAKNGLGTTYPNPLVGCVLVHNNAIIGEGYHYKAGLPHAEVNAVQNTIKAFEKKELTTAQQEQLFKEATCYVSLEPCSHFGKTPPCADLLIAKGIKKVVVGSTDPNPKVAGRGIKKLMEAGCEVVIGVLEDACNDLNKRFFTFQNNKRPYIILKWAQTQDGFIAPVEQNEIAPVWISNQNSLQRAHKLRAEEQAILVGTTTVLKDNPSLTARHWKGDSPTRIILDRTLKIATNHTIYDGKEDTIIITEKIAENRENIKFIKTSFVDSLAENICKILYNQNIQSVIIEGGTKTIQTFINENLWDEALVFQGSKNFQQGVEAPQLEMAQISEKNPDSTRDKNDTLIYYKNSAPAC